MLTLGWALGRGWRLRLYWGCQHLLFGRLRDGTQCLVQQLHGGDVARGIHNNLQQGCTNTHATDTDTHRCENTRTPWH
jgi:hypothetical protein